MPRTENNFTDSNIAANQLSDRRSRMMVAVSLFLTNSVLCAGPAVAQITSPYQKQAKVACAQGDYSQAEKLLALAWQDAQRRAASVPNIEIKGAIFLDVVDGYLALSRSYAKAQRYDRAETLMKWCISVSPAMSGVQGTAAIMARTELAKVYLAQSKTKPAEIELQQALAGLSSKSDDPTVLRSTQLALYQTYADLCDATGRAAEAYNYRQKAKEAAVATATGLSGSINTIRGALK